MTVDCSNRLCLLDTTFRQLCLLGHNLSTSINRPPYPDFYSFQKSELIFYSPEIIPLSLHNFCSYNSVLENYFSCISLIQCVWRDLNFTGSSGFVIWSTTITRRGRCILGKECCNTVSTSAGHYHFKEKESNSCLDRSKPSKRCYSAQI